MIWNEWRKEKFRWLNILQRSRDKTVIYGCRPEDCVVGLIVKQPLESEIEEMKKFGKWIEKQYKKSRCEVKKQAGEDGVVLICFVREKDLNNAMVDMIDFADKLVTESWKPLSEE